MKNAMPSKSFEKDERMKVRGNTLKSSWVSSASGMPAFFALQLPSSSLHHENVVETIDLIHDEHSRYCEVMEYLAGGDLYSRISKHMLNDPEEINCYFRQLVNGVSYLHSVGVAHRGIDTY